MGVVVEALRQIVGQPAQIGGNDLAAPDPWRLGHGREHLEKASFKVLIAVFPLSVY
jgi:hypothetical protein